MKTQSRLKPWMIGVFAILLLAGIAWAAAPGRFGGGIQMTPQAAWGGTTGVGGIYYKTSSGMFVRNPDNTETGPLGSGGGAVTQGSITALRTTTSAVDLALAGATVSADAGSFTYGELIVPTKAGLVMTGIRFYWPGGFGALSVKVSLWNAAGARVDSATVAVNAAGAYTGTFASPQTLTAFKDYRISTWETSGARAIMITGANVSAFTGAVLTVATGFNGKSFWPGYHRYQGLYLAGDAYPTASDATDLTGVLDPLFQ